MYIRDTFATKIEERIEPVVKVADRKPAIILSELINLVVTPQWEKHLYHILEEYTDAFEHEDEREIGIWISGFFGSGKSLLMKVLGILLQGGDLNTPEKQPVHQLFLSRLLINSPERRDIERFLAICQRKITTSLVGGNLHAKLATNKDSLALIAFRLFAEERGYTQNWSFAWAIEYQIDSRGRTEIFRQRVCELSGVEWEEIIWDSDIYSKDLNSAAADVLPEFFNGPDVVQQAVIQTYHNGIAPSMLIERLYRWCKSQDKGGRKHRLLLQLDELGQWIASGSNTTQRLMEVQALVETASSFGQGRIWVAVTAHGDVQALKEDVQQELYAQINQRFDIQCKLSNEDIYTVVKERLLRKNQGARSFLRDCFQERSGELTDMGSLQHTRRVYPVPNEETIAEFYPYLPWTISVIPNIIKGIAQSTGRDEALTGSNRTMIGVVQGGVIETKDFLNRQVGSLLCLADLYDQLSSDAPIETRTDIHRIGENVKGATEYTARVARALYLLGLDQYIPCTLHNVTLTLVNSFDTSLSAERPKVKIELDRLIEHRYAKQVGETYIFLNTQQRGFQDKVRKREHELYNKNYDLSLKLKEYDSEDSLRFGQVRISGQTGREKLIKVELDGRVIHHQHEHVTVRTYSPIQYYLDQDLAKDAIMKQRSSQEPNTIFFRMGDVKELRRVLARAVATREIADDVLSSGAGNTPEKEVAQQAKQKELQIYEDEVGYRLAQAVLSGKIFLRGSSYQLMDGESAREAVRNTLGQLLPIVYARFHELPHRIVYEEAAVKAALNDNTSQSDLQALGVYKADGTLNESNSLISTLKGRLPQAEDDQGTIGADELRLELEKPPYGWDSHAVKVGLALLLRASQCRLIENSSPLTDPHSLAVLQALTKPQRFKALRVQGVRSELNAQELLEIRGYMQTVFDVKPSVVAPTLNNTLGEQLKALQEQAQIIKDWATTAVCPLPQEFASGESRVSELLNSATPAVRLPYFLREWETILQYKKLLHELMHFKNEQGMLYTRMREFFHTMINADVASTEVTNFLDDWRTVVTKEHTVTHSHRWNDLLTAYHVAQQALTDQIELWKQEVRQELKGIGTDLSVQIEAAGVPSENIDAEVTSISRDIQLLQNRLEGSTLSYSDARKLRTDFMGFRMNLPTRIREAGRRYQPTVTEQLASVQEVYLTWQNTIGKVRISSPEELEQIAARLRKYVTTELARGKIVILE